MEIRKCSLLQIESGDFGTLLIFHNLDPILLLPVKLYDILTEQNIGSVEELLSYLHCFPSYFLVKLDWTMEELEQAMEKLKKQLKGYLRDEFLNPGPPPKYGLGANPPTKK